jgi:glutathione S-transferase
MVLYTCTDGKALGGLPALIAHPCGRAAKGLDDCGHDYELKMVKGGVLKFWTLPNRARDRAEIQQLSGQRSVPILILDDGQVLSGSGAIVRWAQENAPQPPPAAT